MEKNKFSSIKSSEFATLKNTSKSKEDNIEVIKDKEDEERINNFNDSHRINSSIGLPKKKIYDYRLNKIRIYTSFLAEFGFILILFIIYLFLLIPTYHPSIKIFSKTSSTYFDSDYNPQIFLHFSDIFLSEGTPRKSDVSLLLLKSFLDYNPDLILITGNVVDNYKGKTEKGTLKPGCQSPDDWKLILIYL